MNSISKFFNSIHPTVWILFSMVLGIIVGYTMPTFSKEYLGLLSSAIFLPMIKACLVRLILDVNHQGKDLVIKHDPL